MPDPKCHITKEVSTVIDSIHSAEVWLRSRSFGDLILLRRKQLVRAGFSNSRLRVGNQLVVDVRREANTGDLNVSLVITYNGKPSSVGIGKRWKGVKGAR